MSYVDLAIGLGVFLFFLTLSLMISMQHFVETPAKLTVEEYRERAVTLFEKFFGTTGTPSNWEDTGTAPSELGLITTIYRIPVLVEENSNTNRVNEPVAVNLDFDDECIDKAWNNTIRVYDENFNEIPYELSHENFCSSQFLKNSTVTFDVNLSANQKKEYYVWYSPDDSIAGPNYTLSIVGYWKFDDGSGTTAKDSSGNANDGTLYNGSGVCSGGDCPTWVDGKYGYALEFDGVDDYVRNSNPSSLNFATTNEITIEAWFKLTGHSGYDGIVSINDGSCAYRIMVNPDLHPFWDAGQHADQYTTTFTFELNKWYHYVMKVIGGGNSRIYINGELIDERSGGVPATLPDGADILIGTGEGPGVHPTQGIIDEVRVWNKALSAEEINSTFSSPLVVKTFPEEKIQVVSKKKVNALENLTYEQLRDITGENYRFRIEITGK